MKSLSQIIGLLIVLLLSNTAFAQLEGLENLEEIDAKGFFKSEFNNLFSDFTDFGEPFNLAGGIGLNMRSYSAFGEEPRQDPFFYSLNANVNIRIYQLNMPFSLLVSAKNTESSLPNFKELINAFKDNVVNKIENQKNRFIRFGVSPRYKFIKLHFGHRSMNFSPFTLANLNFYGMGTEITPGNVRFSAMYGRLAKAEPIDLSLEFPNDPIYHRKGWGTKMGYGNNEEYVDLILFKALDDSNSITFPDEYGSQIDPQENLVIGLNFQKRFFENIVFKTEYANSAFTPNSLEGTAGNQFPHPGFLINGTATTEYRTALDSKLDFEAKIFTLGVQYKRIDPNFQSLGAYFFNSDIQDIVGNLSFGLLDGAIGVNTSAGIQSNNIDKSQPSTLTRIVISGDANYAKGNFSTGVNYSNNISDVAFLLSTNLDSLNVIIVTQDAGLNTTYSMQDKAQNQHVWTGSFNIQQVTDEIDNPLESASSQMLVGNFVYNFALAQSKWKFTTKFNFNQNKLSQMLMQRYGLGFGIAKSFLEGNLSTGFDINYFITNNENTANTANTNGQIRLNWNVSDAVTMNMNWGLLGNRKSDMGVVESFNELTGTFGFQYNFIKQPRERTEEELAAKAAKKAAKKEAKQLKKAKKKNEEPANGPVNLEEN